MVKENFSLCVFGGMSPSTNHLVSLLARGLEDFRTTSFCLHSASSTWSFTPWPRHFFSCICLRTHNGSHKLPVTSPLLKFIHCRHTNCGRWSYIILVVCSEHYIGVLRTLQWCAQNIPVVCSEHSSGVLSFHETVCSVFISVECQLSKHIGTEKYLDDWNIN